MKKASAFLFLLVLTGCGMNGCQGKKQAELPETIAELRDVAVQSRDDAKAARAAKTPVEASTAADRAEAAVKKATALLAEATEPRPADEAAKKEATLAARDARRHARLADEDRKLADMLTGWKARTYRSGRLLAFPAACIGLAAAADQAAKTDPDELPDAVRKSAETAAGLAGQYARRKPLPNGQPDWPAVAGDLRGVASKPPPEMALGLAAAFLVTRKKEFALYEIEMIDPDAERTRDQRLHYHLLRGFIYSVNGLPLLAGEEINKAPGLNSKEDPSYGPQLLAGVNLLLAYIHIEAKDYEAADREIVRAMQAWPDNPIAVFLTGEKLAATGEYEKAALSLENSAKGTDNEWLAEKIARRARELRDNPGKSETLIHDDGFLCDIAIHYVARAARDSDAARSLQNSIESAKELSRKVVQQLPGAE